MSYKKITQTNPETGAYLIEVSLDRYEDIFNEWDPAPFKRRDMDPDLRKFLETNETDIPDHEPIELWFEIPEDEADSEKEENTKTGLSNYFQYEVVNINKALQRIDTRSIIHLTIAICLLFTTTLLNKTTHTPFAFNMIKEGVTIGSWVFTWEAISTFFFGRIKFLRRRKQWTRLSKTPIQFHSNGNVA